MKTMLLSFEKKSITSHIWGKVSELSLLGTFAPGSRECNPGTRVPKNPGNPPVFKPLNPGLCAGKNLGLTDLISGVSQYSVHCAEKRA